MIWGRSGTVGRSRCRRCYGLSWRSLCIVSRMAASLASYQLTKLPYPSGACITEIDSSSADDRKLSGRLVLIVLSELSLFNCTTINKISSNIQQTGQTFATESATPDTLALVGLLSWATSSEASSSISVVSVPFEVTGDGPTISLGLVNCRPLGERPSSIPIDDLGRSEDDSVELRADLSQIISRVDKMSELKYIQRLKSRRIGRRWRVWRHGEICIWGEARHDVSRWG